MDPYKQLYGRIMLTIGTIVGGGVTIIRGPWALLGATIVVLVLLVASYRRA
jgi:hypothetical protein